MKIAMVKLVLIFTILSFVLTAPLVFAQEASLLGQVPPTISPTGVVSSAGAPFNVGWNYFTVTAGECTLKNVFNELQAAGGGALLVQEIWKEEGGKWKMFSVTGSESVKVDADNIFAFNSNQKFYLNITPDACKTKNTNRDAQIEQVRSVSTGQKESSFLEKLLSVPGDFWSGLLGKMEVNKQDNSLPNPKYSADTAVFNTLNVLNKTTVTDLGITGKISSGLLSINGLDNTVTHGSATINTLSSDLYLQNQLLGGINILNGRILIDTNGNLKLDGGSLTAKKVETDELVIRNQSKGQGIILAGQTQIEITTPMFNSTSKVFVTPITKTGKQPLIVENKPSSFVVFIEEPFAQDIKFNWFIIN